MCLLSVSLRLIRLILLGVALFVCFFACLFLSLSRVEITFGTPDLYPFYVK